MSNTSGNPLLFTTAGSKTGTLYVRQIQWVDSGADIADEDDMVISLNGVTVSFKIQMDAAPDSGNAVMWNVGPFNPPVKIEDFEVVTLDHGNVLVWLL